MYSILSFLLNYLDVVFLSAWHWVTCLNIAAVFDKNTDSGLRSKTESEFLAIQA